VRRHRSRGLLVLALALGAGFAGLDALGPREGEAQRLVPTADPKHWRIKYADSLVSINDRCAVKEGALSTDIRPIYVNGKPVGFCCTTCPPVFMQGPEPYLERMKAKFKDPVFPAKPAQVTARLRYHVNWEIFYFADRLSLDEFRRNVTRYCGTVTDPVNGVRFRPAVTSPVVRHGGRPYYFTSDANRVRFQTTPMQFAIRKGA
jgi:YHS domain-containing protein